MKPRNLFFYAALIGQIIFCTKKAPLNIEKSLSDEIIGEFTEARLAHYLKGGTPASNQEILEKVLSRRSISFFEYKPVLRRFEPALDAKLFPKK